MNTTTDSNTLNSTAVGSASTVGTTERQRLGHRVTQWTVTKAEWIKLRSVRSNIVGITAAAAVLTLLGMLFAALDDAQQRAPGTEAANDALSVIFGGMGLSQLIIGVLAALFVANEYNSGLIRTTFGAVGRRTRVLRAKAIVFGSTTWLAMTIGAFGAFFAGSATYSGDLASYSIGDPGVLRAVLAAGFYGACVALIGIALGFLLRGTASAIGVLLGMLMLAPVLVNLLPGSLGDTLTKILPSKAGDAIMSVTTSEGLLSAWQGFAVLMVWVIGMLGVAVATLRRRDA